MLHKQRVFLTVRKASTIMIVSRFKKQKFVTFSSAYAVIVKHVFILFAMKGTIMEDCV